MRPKFFGIPVTKTLATGYEYLIFLLTKYITQLTLNHPGIFCIEKSNQGYSYV